MKKMKVLAALTATMCCMSTAFTPIMTTFAETENRDKVYDTSLILPEETINVDKALRSLLWNSETNTRRINAYTALKQDKRTIEVHSTDPAVIEVVKAFVKDNALNEALIEYVLDEEEQFTDGDEINGDANCDGAVDMADAVLIMQSLANPSKYGIEGTNENCITERGRKKADIAGNNDGITNADALAIQKKLLNLE